jgi:general transcription factor 3C polypeptide 3 (transcription factor C subunit 4)
MESSGTGPEVLVVHYTHLGHFALESRNYLTAIQYYQKARKMAPDDPVIHLCLGVVYIQRSTQKHQSRPDNILKGFAYLKHYQKIRGECPETNYNIARAFHHIGVNHLAIRYYEKVLQDPSPEYKRVTAYNLHLIYTTTGSPLLAQRVLFDYGKW